MNVINSFINNDNILFKSGTCDAPASESDTVTVDVGFKPDYIIGYSYRGFNWVSFTYANGRSFGATDIDTFGRTNVVSTTDTGFIISYANTQVFDSYSYVAIKILK